MASRLARLTACSLLVASCIAHAASTASDVISRSELRSVRIEARLFSFALKAEAPSKTEYDLSVGAAFSDAEDGTKIWASPLELDITLPDGVNVLKIKSDGYSHAHGPDGTKAGLSALSIGAAHSFKSDDARMAVRFGVAGSIPTGGDVGGSAGSESISTTGIYAITADWTGVLALSESRRNVAPASGASRFATTGLGMLRYSLDALHKGALIFDCTARRGAGGSSELAVEYDFPLTSVVGGVLTFTRGLTKGSHDNSAEFDLTWSF